MNLKERRKMEEIEEKKKKSNTSAKSKNTNSVKKAKEKKIEVEECEPIKIQTTKAKKVSGTNKKVSSIKVENKIQQSKKEKDDEINKKTKKKRNINKVEVLEKLNLDETKILEEQEEIEETEKKEVIIQEIDIQEIQNKIEMCNKIPAEDNKKIKHKVVPNIMIALVLTVFYIFIELGFKNIETINYIVDLKVFSGIFLVISIVLFEKAYKNEKVTTIFYAIEMLVLSIFNFALIYIYYATHSNYEMIVFGFTVFEAVYYIIKTIIMYIKNKKDYFFEKSDIKE